MQISDTEMTALRCQPVSAQSAPARLSGCEYAELPNLVRKAGLLHRRTRYYTWKMLCRRGAGRRMGGLSSAECLTARRLWRARSLPSWTI